jgi:glucokinase
MILAGDVGGTKTNLAIFSSESGPREPLVEESLPSGKYPSLAALMRDFLSQTDHVVQTATLGVAGPVVQGRATITNLPWVIEEEKLEEEFDLAAVRLLNDLVAIANAVPFLEADDVHVLHEGQPVDGGAIGIIAPGTGLGEAFLTWSGERYQAHPSEGGHVDFGPTDELESGLLEYLRGRFDHVSYERVCSGLGIPNIYDYLKEAGVAEEPDWLAQKLSGVDDRTPVIAQAAMDEDRPCELCQETMNLFLRVLGAEAGNLALKVLATGGIYLGGGIPPRILPALEKPIFRTSFLDKGRFDDLLDRMPIKVILNPKAAILGAACYGLEREPSAQV